MKLTISYKNEISLIEIPFDKKLKELQEIIKIKLNLLNNNNFNILFNNLILINKNLNLKEFEINEFDVLVVVDEEITNEVIPSI